MNGRLFEFQLDFLGADYVVPFPSYFVLLLTGFLFATVIGALWAKRVGHDPDVIVDLGLAVLLAGVAGGRILHVLVDGYFWDYVHLCTNPNRVEWHVTRGQCLTEYRGYWDMLRSVCRPREADCLAWAKFYAGGLTYYGGFATGSLAALYLLKVDRFPFWRAADMAGLVVPVGLVFGRLGCFLAGCCFGTPTTLPWGVSFPGGSPASEAQAKLHLIESPGRSSLSVHPTQLYESAACLAIAAFLVLHFHGKKRYDGQVFLAFVGLYALSRFLLEFWRSDDRGGLLGLSTSQLIGLALLGGVVYLHRLRTRPQPPVAPAPPLAPPPAESAAA